MSGACCPSDASDTLRADAELSEDAERLAVDSDTAEAIRAAVFGMAQPVPGGIACVACGRPAAVPAVAVGVHEPVFYFVQGRKAPVPGAAEQARPGYQPVRAEINGLRVASPGFREDEPLACCGAPQPDFAGPADCLHAGKHATM